MQSVAAYTESFCIITPGGFLYRRVLYKYMLGAMAAQSKGEEMPWKLALDTILGLTLPLFACDEPQCAVIGSVASALQGCQVSPRDIDLLAVKAEVVYRFAEQMSAYTPPQCEHAPGHEKWLSSEEMLVSVGPDDYGFVWHFGRWEVDGEKVEIAHIVAPEGFPTSEDGAGIWEAGPEIWPHIRKVMFAGHAVPVVSLEIQLETNLSRGLEERSAEIIAVLHQRGYDSRLVQKALNREHLRTFEALVKKHCA
jgi:hypothetical protein